MALGPLPQVPQGLKIRLIYDWGGRPAVSVMNARYTGTVPDVAGLTTAANSMATLWDAQLKAVFITSISRKGIELTDLASRTGATYTNTVTSAGTKTPTQPLPANCAACISWKVNYRFRGGHARTYHPGLISGDQSGVTGLAGATITALTNAYRAWLGGINGIVLGGAPLQFSMLSYFTHDANHHPIYLPVPQLYPIQDCIVHSRMDSMRTRLGKETT